MKHWIIRYGGLGWVLGLVVCASGCMQEYSLSTGTPTSHPSSPRDYVEVSTPAPEAEGQEAVGTNTNSVVVAPAPPTVVMPPNVRTNGPVAEVILLARAAVDPGVMLAYITNWSGPFGINAQEIIYLKDLGVTSSVMTAILDHDNALQGVAAPPVEPPSVTVIPADSGPVPPPMALQPLPPETTDANLAPVASVPESTFYDALAPYGNWLDGEDYGRLWQPSVAIMDQNWQPYLDGGNWLYTDCGWYWSSTYSWGWAPFHYGRWVWLPRRGWCWEPGGTWGPAWVVWRHTAGQIGWAPLPPGAHYHPIKGLTFHGKTVGVTATFGLGVNAFAFVPWSHFQSHNLRETLVGKDKVQGVFEQSVASTRFVGTGHNLSNQGISREHVASVTRTPVIAVSLREMTRAANGTPMERPIPGGRAITIGQPAAQEELRRTASRQTGGVETWGTTRAISEGEPRNAPRAIPGGEPRNAPHAISGSEPRSTPHASSGGGLHSAPNPGARESFVPPARPAEPGYSAPARPTPAPQPSAPTPAPGGSPHTDSKGR